MNRQFSLVLSQVLLFSGLHAHSAEAAKNACLSRASEIRGTPGDKNESSAIELFKLEQQCKSSVETYLSSRDGKVDFRRFLARDPTVNNDGRALQKFLASLPQATKQANPVLNYLDKYPTAYEYFGTDTESGKLAVAVTGSLNYLKTLKSIESRRLAFDQEASGLPNLCNFGYSPTWQGWTEATCKEALTDRQGLFEKYPELSIEIQNDLKMFQEEVIKIRAGKKHLAAKTAIVDRVNEMLNLWKAKD